MNSAHPPEGLGTNLQTLMSICRHSGDMEAVDALAQVETNQGYRSDIHNNITEVQTQQGTSTAYTMRRLMSDTPELHARVIAGELSPHAAGEVAENIQTNQIGESAIPESQLRPIAQANLQFPQLWKCPYVRTKAVSHE